MRARILTSMVLLFIPTAVLGQNPKDSWESVMQVPEGQRLKVVDMKWKAWTGEFVSATEDAITIRTVKGEVTLGRDSVFRVTDLGWSKRGRNAAIGFVVGTAVGGVLLRHPGDLTALGAFMLATGMFGWPGAAVGATFPSHPTIYRTKHPPRQGSSGQQRPPSSDPTR